MTLLEAIKIMDQVFPAPPAGLLSARNGKRLHAAGLLAKAAMKRQIPMKPRHIHKRYPTHDWILDNNGEIDLWAVANDCHNGPMCKRCHESYCVNCDPDWASTPCIVDKDVCPTCGGEISNDWNCCVRCGQALDRGHGNE